MTLSYTELRKIQTGKNGLGCRDAQGREGIARVFYCTLVGRRIVLLHVFVKKTPGTPKRELAIARQRQREVCGK